MSPIFFKCRDAPHPTLSMHRRQVEGSIKRAWGMVREKTMALLSVGTSDESVLLFSGK